MLPPPFELNSFPGVLLEGLNLWKRVSYQSWNDTLVLAQQLKPDIVVLVGESSILGQWHAFFEKIWPRLFCLAHPPAETDVLIESLIQRTALIRRKRLQDQTQLPELHLTTQSNQLFSRLVGQTQRDTARERSEGLIRAYGLDALMTQVDADSFERGLRLLAILESYWGQMPVKSKIQALDIGCHAWSYAPFLKAFYAKHNKPRSKMQLTGLELDPWYLQGDGFSRDQWARYYAGLSQAIYLNGDLAEHRLSAQNFITWLMPIILPQNALRWGIPQAHHQPLKMLIQLRQALASGGQLLIFNGAEIEFKMTLSLLRQMQWQPRVQENYLCPLKQRESGFVIVLDKEL